MAEFFYMGGHAFFIWTSYAIVFVVLLYHFIAPVMRRKKLLREIARQPLRKSREKHPQ